MSKLKSMSNVITSIVFVPKIYFAVLIRASKMLNSSDTLNHTRGMKRVSFF